MQRAGDVDPEWLERKSWGDILDVLPPGWVFRFESRLIQDDDVTVYCSTDCELTDRGLIEADCE